MEVHIHTAGVRSTERASHHQALVAGDMWGGGRETVIHSTTYLANLALTQSSKVSLNIAQYTFEGE